MLPIYQTYTHKVKKVVNYLTFIFILLCSCDNADDDDDNNDDDDNDDDD